MARDAAVTSQIMGKIKRRDTAPELILRRALYGMGIRYRVDSTKIFGRPDISMMKYRLAVFVDGDFWHGNAHNIRGLSRLEDLFLTNSDFWCKKIQANIERDRQVSQRLSHEGLIVIRLWASAIPSNPNEVAESIYSVLDKIKATGNSTNPYSEPSS
jgi:DNA mismatch endonuclease (patch repair protein)